MRARAGLAPLALVLLGLGLLPGGAGRAQAPAATPLPSLELPEAPGPHWIWIADFLLARVALMDAASGAFLGMISGGTGLLTPAFAPERREIYLAETHRTRTTRGERTDVVSIYDRRTLEPAAEVVIPPRRATYTHGAGAAALSDDGRFLAVFNLTPAPSVSVVDLVERRFAGEIQTPGCSLVYAAGARRLLSLCADGGVLVLELDERGREAGRAATGRFFDPERDPLTEKGVRARDRWLFASFEGMLHEVDAGSRPPRAEPSWSLVDPDERADGWRIGGLRHLDVDARGNELYTLMHEGGPDSHKEGGTEVWVYDLARRERVRRIALRNPSATFVRQTLALGTQGVLGRSVDWALQRLLPHSGAEMIAVTHDPDPLLVAAASFPAVITVYDARSGAYLRDLDEPGFAIAGLGTP
jgi:methylamine dehydrogenase heavy chain